MKTIALVIFTLLFIVLFVLVIVLFVRVNSKPYTVLDDGSVVFDTDVNFKKSVLVDGNLEVDGGAALVGSTSVGNLKVAGTSELKGISGTSLLITGSMPSSGSPFRITYGYSNARRSLITQEDGNLVIKKTDVNGNTEPGALWESGTQLKN